MGRRPNLIPSIALNVALPLDVHTLLSAHLYSDLEGRVPHASYQRFLVELIRERLTGDFLDLAPWLGSTPGALIVNGTNESIKALYGKLCHE